MAVCEELSVPNIAFAGPEAGSVQSSDEKPRLVRVQRVQAVASCLLFGA